MSPSHPSSVQFYPTLRCNMSCSFCFNQGLDQVADMDMDAYRMMLSVLADHGVSAIDILGGEPTLHDALEQMVDTACEEGLEVFISSNGTRIQVLEQIIEAFGDRCMVGVSINDEAAVKTVAGFLASRRPVAKSLYRGEEKADSMTETVLKTGASPFYLIYPDIIAGNLEDSVPFLKFHEYIEAARGIGGNALPVFCSGFLPDLETYPVLGHTRCPAGVTKLGIMPDGSAYPCNLFFSMKEFRLGNILSDDFDVIWNSPKLGFFRHYEGNHCARSDCSLHSQCHGGCPAHAVKFSGRLDGPEPRCVFKERNTS